MRHPVFVMCGNGPLIARKAAERMGAAYLDTRWLGLACLHLAQEGGSPRQVATDLLIDPSSFPVEIETDPTRAGITVGGRPLSPARLRELAASPEAAGLYDDKRLCKALGQLVGVITDLRMLQQGIVLCGRAFGDEPGPRLIVRDRASVAPTPQVVAIDTSDVSRAAAAIERAVATAPRPCSTDRSRECDDAWLVAQMDLASRARPSTKPCRQCPFRPWCLEEAVVAEETETVRGGYTRDAMRAWRTALPQMATGEMTLMGAAQSILDRLERSCFGCGRPIFRKTALASGGFHPSCLKPPAAKPRRTSSKRSGSKRSTKAAA